MKRSAVRIAAVSPKRAALNRERRIVLAKLGQERGPGCEAGLDGCTGRWQDGHELRRRSAGGSIIDPENIRLVCRADHEFITANPAWALANGWQISRYGT